MLSKENIYTVTRLNRATQTLLENHLGWIWIQGEISNVKQAVSGHYYFSLKDEDSQVRCVFFAGNAQAFPPENGKQVLALAKVGLYQPRGEYQLNIQRLEDAGLGLLQIEFEKLKQKLAAQGLFDTQFKRPLPSVPRTIGVITSPRGAAIRDILTTLKRRFIAARIIIYPTEVQGKTAAPKIAKALHAANSRRECDVLILGRGGGSTEDLWPFNEEIVAWAIFNSEIPIVTGIGHQIDTTIADYVADVCASTPTAAAETVTPNQQDWLKQMLQFLHRGQLTLQHTLDRKRQELHFFQKILLQLPENVQTQWQKLDHLLWTLKHSLEQQLSRKKWHLQQLSSQLNQCNPIRQLHQSQMKLSQYTDRLNQTILSLLHCQQKRFAEAITALRIISPLATLERGYSLAMTENNRLIREPDQVNVNDSIIIKLAKMNLLCKINTIQITHTGKIC